MNIIIVGGGLVGSTLAARLSRDGHDVTLIERETLKVREFLERIDVQVMEGNGAGAAVLRRAGIEDADLLVATTNSDETNLVVGMLGTSLFQVPRVVVRLRDSELAEGFGLLSKDHPNDYVRVDPENAAVEKVLSLLEVPGAVDMASFLGHRVLLAGFRIAKGSDFDGLTLQHIRLMFPAAAALVAAIQRDDDWIIPHGDEEIRAGDLVYFALVRDELHNVLSLIGAAPDDTDRVMIAGATRVGIELARRLEEQGTSVILIEENRALAQKAEQSLNRTLVVCGLFTAREVLEEEEIEKVSTFVAVTPDHEDNLVASLLAKRMGARRAFAMVDNPALVNLIGEIGIDAVISPRLLAVGLTLQHIKRGRVRAVATLLEDKVEVVEAEALAGSRITKTTLADIDLPRGILALALLRGGKLLMPSGADRIQAGDQVLFITTTEKARRLGDFLSVS